MDTNNYAGSNSSCGPVTQNTFGGVLGCIWPRYICSLDSQLSLMTSKSAIHQCGRFVVFMCLEQFIYIILMKPVRQIVHASHVWSLCLYGVPVSCYQDSCSHSPESCSWLTEMIPDVMFCFCPYFSTYCAFSDAFPITTVLKNCYSHH